MGEEANNVCRIQTGELFEEFNWKAREGRERIILEEIGRKYIVGM
jgi:hypothetical protein